VTSSSRVITSKGEDLGRARAFDSPPFSLDELTLSSEEEEKEKQQCPDGWVYLDNVVVVAPTATVRQPPPPRKKNKKKIPRIIHQTSKSRCVTQRVAAAAEQWRGLNWRHYFHDDGAVRKLLLAELREFPHLVDLAAAGGCLAHGTLRADVWRYLVLWVYGGIYVDIDAVPGEKFNAETTIQETDDALFVVEQYHLLSQYFMAVSPRHPLMYYALQHSMANLLKAPDTGTIPAAAFTGPHALHAAYMSFRKDAGEFVEAWGAGKMPVRAGHYLGSYNRSVTVLGVASNQNEYINRDVLGNAKKREYRKMGMRHFQEDKKHATGKSCLSSLLDLHYNERNSALHTAY
jgi:hypothetical protein